MARRYQPIDVRVGPMAPFRAHADHGCLTPMTGPKRPGIGYSESGQLATNAVQQIASYSITPSARAGVLPDRMSTPRRRDAGVPQRPRPARDAHASLLKLPPPQIIFCAATPAPGLRPLVWVNAP